MINFRLARAAEHDLPFIMATERHEGYDAFVGRWDEERHYAALADGKHAYFLGYADSEPVGFAIVRDWDSSDRVTLVKRLAVSTPGQGHGRQILSSVADAVFQQTNAHRLWLGVFPENTRARCAYKVVGFVEEGVTRESALVGGIYRSELSMSILRPEWLATQTS